MTFVFVKLNKINIDTPYCLMIGTMIGKQFSAKLSVFYTKEDFEEYQDALNKIFEPHERPRIVFI